MLLIISDKFFSKNIKVYKSEYVGVGYSSVLAKTDTSTISC